MDSSELNIFSTETYDFIQTNELFESTEKIESIMEMEETKNENKYKYLTDESNYIAIPNKTNKIDYSYEITQINKNIFSTYINGDNLINTNSYKGIIEYLLENYYKTDSGIDLEIPEKNKLFIMTNTENQKNNIDKNKTCILLLGCETKLKIKNNIPLNASLYILKLDVNEEGMKIPKIEYEIYYPLYDKELVKLNIKEVCENNKVDIFIPVNITENIDKYNSSSNYYNDICSKTTSNKGTDICLSDRKNIFIENNMTLCEEDCHLADYNYTTKKAKCSCLIKIELPLIENIKFDKDKLYQNFKNINNIANIKFLKCYKEVFNKNIKENIGFFLYYKSFYYKKYSES